MFASADGFLNKWQAIIPVGNKKITCVGVCTVNFNADGLIERNEVYFDRVKIFQELIKSGIKK